MLKVVILKNIALIKEAQINLGAGLNVFSGETGAGKSIMVDAVNFLLGAKADKSLIRHGESEAFVEGVFDIFGRDDVVSLLSDIGIEEEETLVISRKLSQDGRNEIRICGKISTLSVLRGITSKLFDVHGQSEHFALSKGVYQEGLVDKFAGAEDLVLEFASEYQNYCKIISESEEFAKNKEERARLIDMYTFQVEEILSAGLKDGEEEELSEKFKLFSSAEKITEALQYCGGALAEDGAGGMLSRGVSAISSIARMGDKFFEISERLKAVEIETEDIFETISDLISQTEFDEAEVDRVGSRIEEIKRLKRKYGGSIEEIEAFRADAEEKLDRMKNADEFLEKLEKQKAKSSKLLLEIGGRLSDLRKKKGSELALAITAELCEVGMENAEFEVAFEALGLENATKRGLDKMEFMFSANLGEGKKPLSKIISGGEMSRFMLGVKNITATLEHIDSMLFDEIDTGISGEVAHLVAQKFLAIAKKHQVIAISHLPQICASGENNYFIYKESVDGKTFTHIKELNEEEKIAETARLSGGDGGKSSLEFAEGLIARYAK